jgi:hypothetical protein
MDLRDIAKDLSQFVSKREEPLPKAPTAVDRIEDVDVTGEDDYVQATDLARATFGYVLSQVDEQDGADSIGQALMLGATTAAEEAGVDRDAVVESMIQFLEDIVGSARDLLG